MCCRAGTKAETRMVRAMPNTPACIGMGITVCTKAADVDPSTKSPRKLCVWG